MQIRNQGCVIGVAGRGILGCHSLDELLNVIREFGPQFLAGRQGLAGMGEHHGEGRTALEGLLAGQHVHHADSQGVNVSPVIDGLGVVRLLWGNEVWGTNTNARCRQFQILGQILGQSHIGNLDIPSGIQEQVGGLDVSVNNSLLASLTQCLCRLQGEAKRVCHTQSSMMGDMPGKVLPFHKLHHQVVLLAFLSEIMDLHNVRVIEGGGCLGFSYESGNESLVGSQLRAENLDSHPAIQSGLNGLINFPHAPLRNPSHNLAVADSKADMAAFIGCGNLRGLTALRAVDDPAGVLR